MNWQPNITPGDRALSVLPYLIPTMQAIVLVLSTAAPGESIIDQVPIFQPLVVLLLPLIRIYYGFPLASFLVFILLFTLVVRNDKISRFIRYNTMQSIILGIVVSLSGLVIAYILTPLGGFVVQTIGSTIFLGILAGVVYSVVQCVRGEYAEIPTISDAVHVQVR